VFGLGLATKIYIAVEPVDMRKGFEGLYGLVRDQLGSDPLSGRLFLFSNRTRTRLKALAILSVVESCRRLSVPVKEYLLAVLPGMNRRKLSEIAPLTPARWQSTRLNWVDC